MADAEKEDTTSSTSSTAHETTANGERPGWQLDVDKLHSLPSEQQDLYLLTFTADLARHTESLDVDGASSQQTAVKRELFQIITLTSPLPARVVRHNLGRCFAAILTRGNRKILYESINETVAILNAGKECSSRTKHAATYCLGTLFEVAGDSAVSLSPLACTALVKLLKPASNDAGLRGAIFRALGKIVQGIVSAIDEELGRGIWKQARSTVSGDKSFYVQANACWCLQQLSRHTTYFDNSNDFEKLQTAVWRAMESASVSLRRAASSCLTTVLVKNYSKSPNNNAVPRIRKPRKVKRSAQQDDDADEIERASSPALEKPATALSYGISDVLKLLCGQYVRPTTSNRMRAGIVVCYIKVFKALGESVVEQNYGEIARHLLQDLLSHPSLQSNSYRLLISRKFVRLILEKVIGGLLGETAQLNACRFLLNDIIKTHPQAIRDTPQPTKQTLTGAISALNSLMQRLDAATGSIAEPSREALLQALQHPSFTVQVQASRALRTLVLACPQQLLSSITVCTESLQRELEQLPTQSQSSRRCVGYAYGLSAVLSTSTHHPLYGSVDVYARTLHLATSLLKSSSSSDLRVSACQLQVAWILIGGLMSLGPNFVKIHLPQLMLIWKNALPKPLVKENFAQRTMLELSYLAHVRECALASIKAFLTFNQRLLTLDISKRLSAMLENTTIFLQSLPEKRMSEDPNNKLSPAFQLQDYEVMVRRRVFQCFSQLLTFSPSGAIEATAVSTILPLAVSSFSSIDYAAPNSLSASIAAAAGTYESIWDVGDNHGFGINGLVSGLDVQDPITGKTDRHWSSRLDEESQADQTIQSPVCGAAENDPTCCYLPDHASDDDTYSPATALVNAAISAFALSLPLQTAIVQESVLERIAASLSQQSLQKDPARKAAITINSALAIQIALKVALRESGLQRGSFSYPQSEKALQGLIRTLISDTDQVVRLIAASALGRLCNISGTSFSMAEVSWLTDKIVSNREPHVRAGCSLALAGIHSHLGGMAAGLHIKNIVGILMSLAADTHPLVHFWAIDSLANVAESAGLNFSGFVTSSIGMLSQLFVSDSHNAETSSLASSNLLIDLPVTAAISRSVDAMINVLGPDLQELTKVRDMILTLVRLFSQEQSVHVLLGSFKCLEHLSLYAPAHLEVVPYITELQLKLDSEHAELQEAAVSGLYNLMRRDAPDVISQAQPGLEDHLWDMLDRNSHSVAIRNIFLNWLQQTGSTSPDEWIARCNTVLTKTKAKLEPPTTAPPKESAMPELQDEEIAGFATTAGVTKEDDGAAATSTQELMRWQVRVFAMECLQTLIAMIHKESAVSVETRGEEALQRKVAEVIRIAFSASTAGVAVLRVAGLRIVEQILKIFGKTPDPDFNEAMLLEQYQAQISSALTPAFAGDSTPELAAEAINVCATFISTGIVTDVERMGRILKLLVSALDNFARDTDTATIGDLKSLSSNAQVMVRMAVFSAWAELQVASTEQKYLIEVVKPHIAQLVPLWLTSLREYARLRFEPDIAATSAAASISNDLDTVYAALNRQTLLQFYQDTWLSLVDAIASLIDEDSEFVFDALDGKHVEDPTDYKKADGIKGVMRQSTGIDYREEPVAFFFVLFGLAFESLAARSSDDDVVTRQRNLDILQALKRILRPSVSGSAIYQDIIFSETMDLMDRMVLTESLSVQSIIVDIARNLCITHPSSRHGGSTPANGETLSDDIEQLFELTRIIVLVIAGLVPGLSETPVAVRHEISEEASSLIRVALQALVDVSDVFPTVIKTDLQAAILHIFITILGTGACQAVVVPQALPLLRRFIVSMANQPQPHTEYQLLNALARMLAILQNARKGNSEASLACEKNTLLASAILVSSATQLLAGDGPLIQQFVLTLDQCLYFPATTRVAAGCIRTLLSADVATRQLVINATSFLLNQDDSQETQLDDSKSLMSQTLVLYTSRLSGDRKSAMITLCIAVFLRCAETQGVKTHAETASRLLELGRVDAAGFRTAVGALSKAERSLMEVILKTQAGRKTERSVDGNQEPSIALKMNF